MKQLTHGSLFAGIGGFDLGFERAGIKTIWQVEIDEYCRRVLAKHWPDVQRFSDVRRVGRDKCDWDGCIHEGHLKPVDIITGGFPCQDISYAGKQAGISGERSGLWREMWRVIGEIGPRFVVVENVAALLGRDIGRVLADLARVGYECEWRVLRAYWQGLPHRRERVFLVANSSSQRRIGGQINSCFFDSPWSEARMGQLRGVAGAKVWEKAIADTDGDDDGIPGRLDRLRVVGNAVVPQIAEWIGRRILEVESRVTR